MADHVNSAAARERIDILAEELMKAMLNAPEPDWAQVAAWGREVAAVAERVG